MNDLLKKIIEANNFTPPHTYIEALHKNFEGAINIDWYNKTNYIEAIFYKDNIEHIAMFDADSILIEYKQNLTEGYLPEIIKSLLISKGEIMNTVLKNKGNTIEYEVIIRDIDLNRFLITLNEIGKIIEEKTL